WDCRCVLGLECATQKFLNSPESTFRTADRDIWRIPPRCLRIGDSHRANVAVGPCSERSACRSFWNFAVLSLQARFAQPPRDAPLADLTTQSGRSSEPPRWWTVT